MKIANKHHRSTAGFSLVEFMLATSITLMMMGGVIYSHIMGQNLHQWSMSKVGANDQSREALGHLQDEIRSASIGSRISANSSNFAGPRSMRMGYCQHVQSQNTSRTIPRCLDLKIFAGTRSPNLPPPPSFA